MKYFSIFFGLIIVLALGSCNDLVENKLEKFTTGGLKNCDSNLVNAILAIEKDTFPNYDETGYQSFLLKCENDSCTNCFNKKYVLVSKYLETLTCAHNWPEDGIDTIFTKQELESYTNQNFEIPTKCYPNYTFVESDSAESWLSRTTPAPLGLIWIYSFSKPLISKNGKYLLVEMAGRCGRLCGGHMTFIIEPNENGWIVNRSIFHAVF